MYIGVKMMKVKFLCIIVIIFLFSCTTTEEIGPETEENTTTIELEIPQEIIPEIIEPEPTAEELRTEWINNYINELTLEEKIGQLFIFTIYNYTEITPEVETFLNTFKPGGIIHFAKNIISDQQILDLNRGMNDLSKTPLFIAVDEEGGLVSRLGKNKNVSVTHLPPALTVGNKGNITLAYNTGKILGREIKALGFNMDMAPVADVNTNPNNPVIGNRTYSNDPYIVADMIVEVIRGFNEEGVISAIKHFPGHGDTSTDTHLGSVISPHNKGRLDQIEFIPFKRGIEEGVDMIMTAHITMPGISSIPLPATLNKEIISGILRNELGYDGIVITDALDMGAIRNNFSSGEAALLAFQAGIDILLMPYDQSEAYYTLLESVNNGDISIKRLQSSLNRIIGLKYDRGLFNLNSDVESIDSIKADPEHQLLIQSIFN